jgi:purine nucleosidase
VAGVTPAPADPVPVFADVDTGVDDAFALVYLFASDDAQLVGIASTGGNAAVQQVCANNLGLLELCGVAGIPVSKGADQPVSSPPRTAEGTHGPAGLGYAQLPPSASALTAYDAAEAWVRAAHAHPGELIGLVTGPLTNLALALRTEPALPALLRRLVIMGGSFDYRGNTAPVAEWNISVDPEAAAEVFAAWAGDADAAARHDLPIVCGLNLTRTIVLTPAILGRLAAAADSSTVPMSDLEPRGTRSVASNRLIRVLEDAMRFYFESHLDHGEGYQAQLHDPFAAAVAVDPDLVDTVSATVGVGLTGALTRGVTIADWTSRLGRRPNARIGVSADPAKFFDRYIERVGPFAGRLG